MLSLYQGNRNHTTRNAGNLVQNAFKPSGAEISRNVSITKSTSGKGNYQVYEDDAIFGDAMLC